MPYFEPEPWCEWDSESDDSDDDDCTEDGFSSDIAEIAPPTADLTTEAGRREVQLDLRERLWFLEQIFRQMGIHAWSDDDFSILTIPVRRMPDLDLDETAPFDPDPLFFHPFRFSGEPAAFRKFIRHSSDSEEQGARWRKPCGTRWTHDGEWCAELSFGWFDYRLAFALGKHLQWEDNASPRARLCGCRNDERVRGKRFRAKHYYRVADAAKPHVMLTIMNHEAPKASSTVLESELISACVAMQHRLRHAEFIHHHTIPVSTSHCRSVSSQLRLLTAITADTCLQHVSQQRSTHLTIPLGWQLPCDQAVQTSGFEG